MRWSATEPTGQRPVEGFQSFPESSPSSVMSILIPQTKDYLQFHAIRSPDALALISNGREYIYDQFYRDFLKFAKAVKILSLPIGNIVAICCEDLYVHLLLIMACENSGMTTASFLSSEGASCLPLLSKADLVIADDDRFSANTAKFHHLTTRWLNDVFLSEEDNSEASSAAPTGVDDPLRLIRSSGTTGSQKMIMKTRSMLEGEINRSAFILRKFSFPSRNLFTLPLTVGATYRRYMLNIRMGVTSIYDTTMSPFNALAKYDAKLISTVPVILEKLLNDIPSSFTKRNDLVVINFGAALPDRLRQRTLTLLATEIIEIYGTNEADGIALMDETGVGTVCPGAEVDIVDEDDNSLPPGEVGRVRVKVPELVSGYVDDPEATAAMFRNGWFYTGDVGVMPAPRLLKILGRQDDLLNIGGLKIDPGAIEDILMSISPLRLSVKDLAVTSIENAHGIEEICVAVVGIGSAEERLIADQIKNTLPAQYGKAHVKFIDRIPRTDSGKIQRYRLKIQMNTEN